MQKQIGLTTITKKALSVPFARIGLKNTLLTSGVFIIFAGITAFGLVARPAQAAINEEMHFQARLLSAAGSLVADGTYNIQFNIYYGGDGAPGTADETLAWTGSYLKGNTEGIDVANGYVSAQLGEAASDQVNTLADVPWDNNTLWLSINIGDTTSTSTACTTEANFNTNCGGDGEMGPFIRLGAVPYAFNSSELGGRAASEFVQLNPGASPQNVNTANAALAVNQQGTGNIVTLQDGGTTVFQVKDGGDVQIGSNNKQGNLLFSDGGATANYITIQAISSLGQDVLLTIPDGASATDTICTEQAANCAGGGSGVTTIGAIDSQTKSANGAVIVGSNLYMQTADGSNPGLVSTSAQTFAGAKTFNDNIILGVASTTNGSIGLKNSTNAFTVTLNAASQTVGNATIALPNTAGVGDTICLLTLGNCFGAGTGGTLQAAYDADTNGSDAVIGLTSADGAVVLRDAASTIGSLFVVEANGGADYFAVTSTGTTITGDVTASSNLAVNGANLTTTQTTFNLLNTNATTINAFGAATILNVASSSASTTTINVGSTGNTKQISSVGTGDFYVQTSVTTGAATNSGGFLFGTGAVTGAGSDSGYVNLQSGNSTTSGNSGSISIFSGNATSGNSGYITLDAGTASGSVGGIQIGNANAGSVLLGRSGITTTNAGALTVTENLIANANVTIGNANTDTLTVNAGTSGTGIRFADGTFASCTALETDASGDLTCGTDADTGGTLTLQGAYANDADGSDAVILLTGTDGAIVVRDAASTIGSLFVVEANGGADYLAVASTGVSVGTGLTVTSGNSLTLANNTSCINLKTNSGGVVSCGANENTYVVAASDSVNSASANYVADGTSDEVEIESAINAANSAGGGTVLLLEGTYNIATSIDLNDDVALIGSGQEATILFVPNSTNSAFPVVLVSGDDNVRLSGFTVDGNNAGNATDNTDGIHIATSSANTVIDHITSRNNGDAGIEFNSSVRGKVQDSILDSNLNNGVSVAANDILIEGNTIVSNGTATLTDGGVYSTGSTTRVIGNQFDANNPGAVSATVMTTGRSNIVDDNYIENTVSGPDIYTLGDNTSITGNTLNNTPDNAIEVSSSSTGTVVSGNAIYDAGVTGIYADGSLTTVSGNTIEVAADDGIFVGGNQVTVVGNTINTPTDMGIFVSSSNYSSIGDNAIYSPGDDGISLATALNNKISGNSIRLGADIGIFVDSASHNNIVSNNQLYDNGGATAADAIDIDGDNNKITGNHLYDSAGTSDYISTAAGSDATYIGGNTFQSGTFATTINNAGTNTISDGQLDSSGNLELQASGSASVELLSNTSITGTLSVSSLGSADTSTYVCRNSSNQLATCTASPLTNSLTDNVTDAFDLQQGTNNYININTTNSSENISFGNATTNPSYTFLGSGDVTIGGALYVGSVSGVEVDQDYIQFQNGGGVKQVVTSSNGSGNSNSLIVGTGHSGAAAATTGDLNLITGDGTGTGTDSGSVYIDTGSATGAAGTVVIGQTNASGITLGRNGITTTNAGALTITQTLTANGSLRVTDGSSNYATIAVNSLASDYTVSIPTITGNDTFCLVTLANCAGGGSTTLQSAYDADADGSDAVIALTGTDGALVVRDAASTVTTLFVVEANGGTDYFAVTSSGTTIGGNATTTGDVTVQGGDITVGTAAQAGGVIISDGSSNTATLAVNALAGNYIISIPTVTANDTICLVTVANCAAGGREFTAVVGTSVDSSNISSAGYVANGNTGSAGDGDQVEINAAIDAVSAAGGGKVLLLEGTYTIDATIDVDDDVEIIGSGQGATIITIPNSLNTTTSFFSEDSNPDNWVIRDLTISMNSDGNQSAGNYTGIDMQGASASAGRGGLIENVEISDFTRASDTGIYLSNTRYTTVRNNRLYNGEFGIYIVGDGSTYLHDEISGNFMKDFDSIGIYMNNVVGLNVSDNKIESHDGVGTDNAAIELQGAEEVSVTDNIISNGTGAGIRGIGSVSDITVKGNRITHMTKWAIEGTFGYSSITNNDIWDTDTANADATYYGQILITGGTKVTVADNNIAGSASTDVGIRFDSDQGAPTDSVISGNVISLHALEGIYLETGSDRTVISGNALEDNDGSGIFVTGSNRVLIQNNSVYTSGTTGSEDGIAIAGNSDYTQIIGNIITDTAGTGSAIDLRASTVDYTYLADNNYSGTGATTINDSGTNTRYANQINPASVLQSGSSYVRANANTVLSGTIDPTASTSVTGTGGTKFTTELVVGDKITVSTETRTVVTITSDTALTVDTAFSNNGPDSAVDRIPAALSVRTQDADGNALYVSDSAGATVLQVNTTTSGSAANSLRFVGVGVFGATGEVDVAYNGGASIRVGNNFYNDNNWTGGTGGYSYTFTPTSYSGASATYSGFSITPNNTFTSGSGNDFNAARINPTLNISGGATATYRGLYINPTLTGFSDFRGLEVAATSSYATANSQTGGVLTVTDTGAVGSGTDTTTGQTISVTRTGGSAGTFNNTGLSVSVTGDSAGTSTNTGLSVSVTGADTNYAAIFQGGNVGIGDLTPAALLTVGASDAFQVTNTGDITTAGDTIISGGDITLGSTTQAGSLIISDGSSNTATISLNSLAGNYAIAIPTITGSDTFCLVTLANCSGSGSTLQAAYTADADGSNAIIVLTNTDGAVAIRDAASTIGSLFVVEANTGVDYLNVSSSDTTVSNQLIVSTGNALTIVGQNGAPGASSEGSIAYDNVLNKLTVYTGSKWEQLNGANTATAVVSTTSSSRPELADYQADGNTGSANDGDQQEINSAINAVSTFGGGTVYLMEGTYEIDASVVIKENVKLVGAGVGATILKIIDNYDNDLTAITETTNPHNFSISDLTINANTTNNTGNQGGITLVGTGDNSGATSANGGVIQNIEITDTSDNGINISFSNFVTVKDSHIFNGETYGIYVESGDVDSSIIIQNNNIHDEGNHGIWAVDAPGVTISGNTVNNNGQTGIYVTSSDGALVDGNTANDNDSGVVVFGGQVTVSNNTLMRSSVGAGVVIDEATWTTVSGNTIGFSAGIAGVYLEESSYTAIDSNTIYGSSLNGIEFGGSSPNNEQNSITGNQISVSTGNGILLNSITTDTTITGNSINTSGEAGIDTNGADFTQINSNTIYQVGAVTGSVSSIFIQGDSDNSSIVGNTIRDTGGTGYAILIDSSSEDNTYVGDNTFSGTGATSISDSGTATQFASQNDGNGDQLFGQVNGTSWFYDDQILVGNTGASMLLGAGNAGFTVGTDQYGTASTNSGAFNLQSGDVSGATSNSGVVTLKSGNSTTSGNSGNVVLTTGNATSGNSGNLTLDVGTASGTTGTISVGATNASAVAVGRSNILTTVQGTLEVNESAVINAEGDVSLTSTADVTINTNWVDGDAGTLYLSELEAGDYITINGQRNLVLSVTANTGAGAITVANNWTATSSNQTVTRHPAALIVRGDSGSNRLVVHDNGHVSINTNEPTSWLTVQNSNNEGAFRAIGYYDTDSSDGTAATIDLNVNPASISAQTYRGLTVANNIWGGAPSEDSTVINISSGGVFSGVGLDNLIGVINSFNDFGASGTVNRAVDFVSGNTLSASGYTLGAHIGVAIEDKTTGTDRINLFLSAQGVGFQSYPTGGVDYSIYNASTNANVFAGALAVGQTSAPVATFDVLGTSQFKTGSDGTAIFEVQEAGGQAYLTIDTESATDVNAVEIGNGTDDVVLSLDAFNSDPGGTVPDGSMFYDANDDVFRCRVNGAWVDCDTTGGGGGGNTVKEIINAEYSGVVLHADGTNNSGTLNSDYDGTNRRNYYDWTSTQSSLQDYELVVQSQIPSDYASGFGTFKIWAYGASTSSANNDIQVTVQDAAGTSCAASTSVLPGSATTWTEQTVTLSGCSYAANDIITITVKVFSKSSNNVRIGSISYQYTD